MRYQFYYIYHWLAQHTARLFGGMDPEELRVASGQERNFQVSGWSISSSGKLGFAAHSFYAFDLQSNQLTGRVYQEATERGSPLS